MIFNLFNYFLCLTSSKVIQRDMTWETALYDIGMVTMYSKKEKKRKEKASSHLVSLGMRNLLNSIEVLTFLSKLKQT